MQSSSGNDSRGGADLPNGVKRLGWVLVAGSGWTILIGLLVALIGLTVPADDGAGAVTPLTWVLRYPTLAGLAQAAAGGLGLVVGLGVVRSRRWAVSGLRFVLIGLLVVTVTVYVAVATYFVGLLSDEDFPIAIAVFAMLMATVMAGLIALLVRAAWKYLIRIAL